MNAFEPRPSLAWVVHHHITALPQLRGKNPVLRHCYSSATPHYRSATPLVRHRYASLHNCYATATPVSTRTPTALLNRHHFDGQFKNFTPVLPNINLHYTALTTLFPQTRHLLALISSSTIMNT